MIKTELTGVPADDGAWAIGSIVGFSFLALFAVLFALGLLFIGIDLFRPWSGGGLMFAGFVLGAVGLVFGTIMAVVLFPYDAKYHQWREASGTVEEVEARLLSSGGDGGMSEMFVVRFSESGREYRVDDSRGALVNEGDTLTIACRQVWEYSAADGQACRWRAVERS